MDTAVTPHIVLMPPGHVRTGVSPSGGVFQFDLGAALQMLGCQVGMVSVSKSPMSAWVRHYRYPAREVVSGIPVFRRYPRTVLPASLDTSFSIGRRLIRHALEVFGDYCDVYGRPDVIHAHNFKYSAFIAEALSDVYGVPYVYTEHSSEILSGSLPNAAAGFLRRAIERSLATTAVSSALRDAMCDITGVSVSKIEVIPNILPIEFETAGVREKIETSEFRFVNVAEALPVKRQALLIQAFAKYFKNANARLTIVGDGPELKALVRLAAKLQISSKVEFLGRLPRMAIREVLLCSDCFVLSSRHETFAVAAIEALSQGLPVVSTQCGGPREFIDDENGMIAVSDSVDGVGQAMVAMHTNRHRYIPGRISERCISSYSRTRVVSSYLRVYERAFKS